MTELLVQACVLLVSAAVGLGVGYAVLTWRLRRECRRKMAPLLAIFFEDGGR